MGSCALCGADAERALIPRLEWVDYIVEERGRPRPIDEIVIPLCSACYPDADRVKEADFESCAYGADPDPELPERTVEFLDRLTLAALEDRTRWAG